MKVRTLGFCMLANVLAVLPALAQTFDAPYSATAPTIDGTLNAAEWTGASSNTITMVRSDHVTTHTATIYLKHDNTWLYIGVNSGFNNAPHMYLTCKFDGNHSHSFDGNVTEPHVDAVISVAGPGRPSYYNHYDVSLAGGTSQTVTPPSGTAKASAESNPVTFEFKVKISELGALPGSLVGFYLQHGNDGSDGYGYTYVDVPIVQWPQIRLLNGSLTQGLVAYYPFNGNANDESGNGNNGSIQGAPTYTAGVIGQAIRLSSDYIIIDDIVNALTNLTIALWVNEEGMSDAGTGGDGEAGEAYIFFGDDVQGWIGISSLGGAWAGLGSQNNVIAGSVCSTNTSDMYTYIVPKSTWRGVWHHCVLTFDAASNAVRLFVDGAMVNEHFQQKTSVPSFAAIGSHTWEMGGQQSYRLIGSVDDVRIYNRALSATEVMQLYTMSGGGDLAPNPALSNVSASWRTGTKLVEGTYNLSGAFKAIPVAIMISTNGGTSYDINGPTYSAVAPGNNRTFSWDMSTVFNNRQCSQMRVKVVAGSAAAESAVFAVDTMDGNRPVVQDLTSPYFNGTATSGTHVYYINGVPLNQDISAAVNWNGKTPGTIYWLCPERFEGLSYKRTFNVGNWFSDAKLTVIAEASDGTQSLPFTANFDVIPPPPLFPVALMIPPIGTLPGTLKYKVPLAINYDYFKEGVDEVPKADSGEDIPGFTGNALQFAFETLASAEIEGDGTAELEILLAEDAGIDTGGYKYKPTLSGHPVWTYDSISKTWKLTGYIRLGLDSSYETPPHYFFMPAPPPVPPGPYYWRGRGEVNVAAEIHLTGWNPSGYPTFNAEVGPEIKAFFVVGYGAADILAIEGAIGGGPKWMLQFPEQPTLKELGIHMEGELKVYLLVFTWSAGFLDYTWWLVGGDGAKGTPLDTQALSDQLNRPDAKQFTLSPRDYLAKSTPYSAFLVQNTVGLLSWGDPVCSGIPVSLQTNVWPYSEAALSVSSTNRMLVLISDNPTRSSENRTELLCSGWNGTSWGNPTSVWNDGTGDFTPTVKAFPDGKALAVWQNERTSLTNGATLADALAGLETAYGVYNPDSGTWQATNLTDNGIIDRGSQLAAAPTGEALLTWISNASNSPSGSAIAPNVIQSRLWNGSAWQNSGTISTNTRMLLWSTVAFNGTNGVFLAAIDGDDDQSTIDDQELFGAEFIAGAWGSFSQWTTNAVQDTKPQATYDSTGNLLVAWYQGSNIVMRAGDLNLAAVAAVGEVGGASSAKDFRLITGPAGQISMVWVDVAEDGTGPDPFMLNYDPALGVWSKSIRIMNNTNLLERSFAGAYATNGSLLLAYNQVHVQIDTNGVPIFTNNVVDLMFLDYLIGGDLGLSGADISLSTNNPQPGQAVDISAVVRNLGELAATNIAVVFYNGNPTGGWVLIGSTQIVAQLAAGASTNVTVPWTLPETVSNQTIYVVVDPGLEQEDRNRANNTASVMAVQPDLVVSEMSVMNSEAAKRMVNARVANEGGMASGQGFDVEFRQGATNGTLIGTATLEALPTGGQFDANIEWDLGGQTFTTAYETVYALADAGGAVSEEDKDNNIGLVQVMTTLDTDNDGLFDGEESRYGTSLNVPDSDGDGLKDGEEVNTYGTGPLIPDSDGDGSKDGDEVRAGTDPNSQADVFAITDVDAATGLSVVQWSAKSNKTYQVAKSWELLTWTNAPSGTESNEVSLQTATGDGLLQYIDVVSSATNRSFYRIDLKE